MFSDCYGGMPKEILGLRNLRLLSLSYHCLHAIPKEMGQLFRLRSLFLSNNPFLESIDGATGKAPLKGVYQVDQVVCTAGGSSPEDCLTVSAAAYSHISTVFYTVYYTNKTKYTVNRKISVMRTQDIGSISCSIIHCQCHVFQPFI